MNSGATISLLPSKLIAVRDLLLPAVYAQHALHPNIRFAIVVNFTEKALVIKGWNAEKKRGLGFAITALSIIDEHYKEDFKPNLDKLVELLNQEAEPVGTT